MNEMPHITDISKDYLKKFLAYAKNHLSYEPIVVGGWAVYALLKTEQSVDADILVRTKEDVKKLRPFFDEHGFKAKEDWHHNFSFELALNESHEIHGIKINDVLFDFFSAPEENVLHENKRLNVPWKLAFSFNQNIDLEGLKFRIPSPELLLAYKVKAYRDRKHDKVEFAEHMAYKKIWLSRKDFKIEKDKRDIKSLIQFGQINPEKLEEVLSKTKFKALFDESLEEITRK